MEHAPEDLLRTLAPQVLGAVVRRYGHFDEAEEAVQEALVVAVQRWGEGTKEGGRAGGIPNDPRAWLIRVASRRLIDRLRSEQARRRREEAMVVTADPLGMPVDADDSLLLLFLCCHPALTPVSQVALTLRAVGGLTTAEIAHAFLVPEPTMGQRISRAKQQIRASGLAFRPPAPDDLPARVAAVLQVLYLIFNEGYATSGGDALQRVELAEEAIRLARMAHRLLPEDAEVAGLLALLLLTHARRDARTAPGGALVAMAEQDRTRWDRALIAEGTALVEAAMARGPLGTYQVQAAIAALHDEADGDDTTDWRQILALYGLLEEFGDNPLVRLNRAVAAAKAHGPRAGLALLATVADDPRLKGGHRLDAVRAHLEEMAGDLPAAAAHYRAAARRTTSLPEQRYLIGRALACRA